MVRIVVDRPDMVTKRQVINMLKENYLTNTNVHSEEYINAWNDCINDIIDVIKNKL